LRVNMRWRSATTTATRATRVTILRSRRRCLARGAIGRTVVARPTEQPVPGCSEGLATVEPLAAVLELAYRAGSKPAVRKDMWVRIPPAALPGRELIQQLVLPGLQLCDLVLNLIPVALHRPGMAFGLLELLICERGLRDEGAQPGLVGNVREVSELVLGDCEVGAQRCQAARHLE
jgi:hypothetical protein